MYEIYIIQFYLSEVVFLNIRLTIFIPRFSLKSKFVRHALFSYSSSLIIVFVQEVSEITNISTSLILENHCPIFLCRFHSGTMVHQQFGVLFLQQRESFDFTFEIFSEQFILLGQLPDHKILVLVDGLLVQMEVEFLLQPADFVQQGRFIALLRSHSLETSDLALVALHLDHLFLNDAFERLDNHFQFLGGFGRFSAQLYSLARLFSEGVHVEFPSVFSDLCKFSFALVSQLS